MSHNIGLPFNWAELEAEAGKEEEEAVWAELAAAMATKKDEEATEAAKKELEVVWAELKVEIEEEEEVAEAAKVGKGKAVKEVDEDDDRYPSIMQKEVTI